MPESRRPEPPRSRLAWAVVPGVLGAIWGLVQTSGEDWAFRAGGATGGFAVLALLGLAVESMLFVRARRRWREDR